jgi:hypothetical protein
MEIVDPKSLPFDPDTSSDEARAEPVDETAGAIFSSLTDGILSAARYLRRLGAALGRGNAP